MASPSMPIFVFASGWRCGSTLIQRWLNSHPEIRIWGEHNGVLNGLIREVNELLQWDARESGQREVFNRWGSETFTPCLMPETQAIFNAARSFIEAMWRCPALQAGRQIWGFKEVRYGKNVAELLCQIFPNARILHLIRHPASTFISLRRWRWEASGLEEAMNLWERINTSFIATEEPWLLSYCYEDIVADPESFSETFAKFLELDVRSFDQSVFQRKLSGRSETMNLLPVDLTSDECKVIFSASRVRLLNELGYNTELRRFGPP